MKKIIVFLLCAGIWAACKKDKSPDHEGKGLHKVFRNDVVIEEYIYSDQKRLARINYYDEITGQFYFASSFEYDGTGRLLGQTFFSSLNKPVSQYVYTWNAQSITQHETRSLSGPDSGQVTVRVKYSYDASGRISLQSWVDLVTNAVYTSRELSYYNNGNLRTSAVYSHSAPPPELQWKTDYSPEGSPLPASLLIAKGYPVNFILYDLVAGEKHFY